MTDEENLAGRDQGDKNMIQDDELDKTKITYRSLKSFGERQEYTLIAELLRRGYDVYRPLVDDQGIDCILRRDMSNGPQYVDLQIKSTSKRVKHEDAGMFAGLQIRDPRENYLWAFYSEYIGATWVIPSLELVSMASMNKTGKNIGKYTINFAKVVKKEPFKREEFSKYEGEMGYKIIDQTFVNMGSRHY